MKIIVTTILHNEVGIVYQFAEREGQLSTPYAEQYPPEDGYTVEIIEHVLPCTEGE